MKRALLLIAFLWTATLLAQPSVRELIPNTAPIGARVLVTGRGLADPNLSVAFGAITANVVQRNDRFLEVTVPASGNVRVTLGAALVKELPFTLAAEPRWIVSTLAGGKQTQNDVFKHPNGVAVILPDGTIAVADEQHDRIVRVTPSGVVTTLATGFKDPRNLAFVPVRRVLYVSDSGNHTIKRVTLDGIVTTLAGSGKPGFKDGTGTAAEFNAPEGITVAADGAIYVADRKNDRIRKVLIDGTVMTLPGTFREPRGIVASDNVLYVADTKNNAIRRIANGVVTTVAAFPSTGDDDDPNDGADGNAAALNRPGGIGVDEAGFLIVADTENDFIRRIDPNTGAMTILAGNGKNGEVDGDAAIAQFKDPAGLAVAGAIYVADEDNDSVRRICAEPRVTGVFSTTGSVAANAELRLLGNGFVPGGTTVRINDSAATNITWISASELSVKLPQTLTGGSVSIVVSACGGTTSPASFVIDNSAPSLTVSITDGTMSKVPLTPVLTASDDADPAPRITATLNGAAFTSGTTITADGVYTLVVIAEDAAGNRTEQTVHFIIDGTRPVVQVTESGAPFVAGSRFARAVIFDAQVHDVTATAKAATIDGVAYTLDQPYAVDGTHALIVKAADALANETVAGPLAFTIDTTAPAIAVTSHTSGAVIGTAQVTLTGTSDDAVSVQINNTNATLTNATFSIVLPLTEGENALSIVAADAQGNRRTLPFTLVLDSRAPALTLDAIAACTAATSLTLHGTVRDPHVASVAIRIGAATTNATITQQSWTASVALAEEGKQSVTVEARDTLGHAAIEQGAITVDRTAPLIELSDEATLFSRAVTLFARSSEGGVTATLDGTPWTSGSAIATEGTHTLHVTARDCAGNESSRTHTFTIDLTPPRFLTLTPASGSRVTSLPSALTGTTDPDAIEVRLGDRAVTVSNGAFSIPNVFAEGLNELTLEVVDRAGHIGRASYTLAVKTAEPLLAIVENGEPLIDGALFTRAIAPEVRVFEPNVTATATLDGAPFLSGTTISRDGAHTLVATATDSAYGRSHSVTRHFTIDRTAPQVAFIAPANGARIDDDHADVRITAADATSVTVNGLAATKQNDVWLAAIPLEFGENTLLAVARDAAGNSGGAAVEVTRGSGAPALLVTFPPDLYVTNRPKIDVVGRVLRDAAHVTITVSPAAPVTITPDPAGAFTLRGATLREGANAILVTATIDGHATSIETHVTADFTPPLARIVASGSTLDDGAGFASQVELTVDAGDAIDVTLRIDGAVVTAPVTITASGGHSAILIARDAAGNETRIERTFFIGAAVSTNCKLEAFDPADQSIVTAQQVALTGRTGGAAGVKVNGVAAPVSNGSFHATVELPREGANGITIVCTNADGTPGGEPVTITLRRITSEPSVTITAPDEDAVTTADTITVTGTLGDGATSVDVNGKPAILSGSTWSVSGVRLADGLNLLAARARNDGGRIAIATRRIARIEDAPVLTITSPVPNFLSGDAHVDVSGTFTNVDPQSIALQGASIEPASWSDTTGRFVARDVTLQAGDNTIAVTGRDRTGRLARAEVTVRFDPSLSSIRITAPADNDSFPASATTLRVTGTFDAPDGASIDVNGVAATIGANTFTADVPFSTLPGGLTPVVARLAGGAFDSLRVFRFADAPRVVETFPAANATEVDPAALVLVLFSASMERTATTGAFRLENASGTAISGKLVLDKDVLTFAPAAALTPGERYTIRVSNSARDLAGQSIEAIAHAFTVATSAPPQAPVLTTASGRVCAQLIDVTGTTKPGARVRIDSGALTFTTTATPTGAFTYKVPLSGQPGYHVIRVRTAGTDGTLSPAAELELDVDCTAPRVLRATFDRTVNELTIVFSTSINPASLTSSAITLTHEDGHAIGASIRADGANAIATPSENLTASTFTLTVTRDVEDLLGRKLDAPHTQRFSATGDAALPPGSGFVSGEIYDAGTGRPLAGATVTIEAPAPLSMLTAANGRYAHAVPEGAHTIRATAGGYTTVWRQIVVAAGAGVIPIDIRLTRRGNATGVALTPVQAATLTTVSAQSLAGLLPLGWSPLASAEIHGAIHAATLTFDVAPLPAGQSLTAVRYDEARDEWLVLAPFVTVVNGKASLDVSAPGAYSLVYADRFPGLAMSPSPVAGAALRGVEDPCANDTCPPMVAKSFPLDPDVVLPNGSTNATLRIDGSGAHRFPSGTAVQAYIDEELHLAGGGREQQPPFAADLLLYRTPGGEEGEAAFRLAPSTRAAEVFLETGFDHIRILPYPGRLDRGSRIGPEGGSVKVGETLTIDIATAATREPVHVTATTIDPQQLQPVAGFTILEAFDLTLTPDIQLRAPATASLQILNPQFSILNSVLLAEVRNDAAQLTAQMSPSGTRWTTKTIDRATLPIDGLTHSGRYVLLAANAPIAFAHGLLRTQTGAAAQHASVRTPTLGITATTDLTGIFALPVPATPAPPFVLIPRTTATGDGAPYTHATAPAADAIVSIGDLAVVAQPPHITSTIPAANATNVALTTTVEATFAPGIDTTSITPSSLTVIDATTGAILNGTASANGILGIRWNLAAGTSLQPGRRYLAAIAANVRGSNGALLAQPYTFAFTTAATVTNDELHPERIRITIPDASGTSKIFGTSGALKANWIAVPIRRGRDFTTRPTATAAADGSFALTLTGVSIADSIDLRVLDTNGALAAIVPLTPFVAEDGRAFIVPAREAVTFTSADGITLEVPAGAFDIATRIDITPATPAAFATIPRITNELRFAATTDVTFTGRAKLPLHLTLPVSPDTDLTREHFLAVLGHSTAGPRLMAIDTLTLIGGKLTTRASSPNARSIRTNAASTNAKDLLQKLIEGGTFAAASLHPDAGTLAWAFVNPGASASEFFWDTLASMYASASYVAEAKGAVALPVPANNTFVLTAVDPATALARYQQPYEGIPAGAPGSGTVIANPEHDRIGPYPMFAAPFRIETVEAPPPGVTLTAIRDVALSLSDTGILTVTRTTLDATTRVSIVDTATGERRGPQTLPLTLSNVAAGHRIVLSIDERDVDPASAISVVFNEPLDTHGAESDDDLDAFLRTVVRFERISDANVDLLDAALLRLDSGGRRMRILLPSILEAGARFRLTLSGDLRDRSGNRAPAPFELAFSTRAPHGTFAELDIRQSDSAQFGAIRELAQYGNLLFVAALDGGVLAYDTSDPAHLGNPIAMAPGRDEQSSTAVTDYWSVHVDHHGRVFSTGMTNVFGVLRSWRVEDFVAAKSNTTADCLPSIRNTVCSQTGSAITSQNPGTATGTTLGSAFVLEDRVEAIPRKASFLIGDAPPIDYSWDTFRSAFCESTPTDAGDGTHQRCSARVHPSGSSYRLQRITIENVTLGLKWSADAVDSQPARMMNVVAAPGDAMRITHNLTTYAVLSLFGFGLAVYDVNAIESNDLPGALPAGFTRPKEQIALRANAEGDASTSLAFTPEAHILAQQDSVKVYALDSRKGATEFVVTPPESLDYTGRLELDTHPRFAALRTALVNAGIAAPIARFNTGALYENPDRGMQYLLLTALDFGLIVARAGAAPLTPDSFADAVAIPGGAYAVRVIDDTNLAAVVNKTGHVFLVDLSRVDELDRVAASGELFPTIARALTPPLSQDPRILWRSEDPIALGNLAPILDADTGLMIGADLLGRRMRLASAIEPHLRITTRNGDTLAETNTVIPLGIQPPSNVPSLAAFRVEARLPGSIAPLALAIESERVPRAEMPQTPAAYPPSHLRTRKRDGSADPRATNVMLKRVIDFAPELRYQKGWNRFASDWIVAIADPRAAKANGTPPADCIACTRPSFVPADAHELFTTGRFISIRADVASGVYAFLDRLEKRITTTPADTVRASSMLLAAQAPPVATGLLQETTYVHSGEVETGSVDYDAGGRAGWNVTLDRTYRSRTLGLTALGEGWDSSLFRRLRALPNGNVEYRDGADLWTFPVDGNEYRSPEGLTLKLAKRDGGWSLIDQQFRVTTFDDWGRITSESDEFFQPTDPTSGNTIQYAYDAQGRLAAVIDPANRVTTLAYDDATGLLRKISDWHTAPRELEYAFDAQSRLTIVKLPQVANTSGTRPQLTYAYHDGGKLRAITDPGESTARVTFDYDAEGRVRAQRWGSGENATFSYPSPNVTRITDVLGQERVFTLTGDRAHVAELREVAVPVWNGASFGQLPSTLTAATPNVTPRDRIFTFRYADGFPAGVTLDGVSRTDVAYTSAPGVAGKLVSSVTTGPANATPALAASWMPSDASITRTIEYQSGMNAASFVKAIRAGSKRVESPEPHRHNAAAVSATNDAIRATAKYDAHGLLQASESNGGTDPSGAGAKSTIESFSATAPPHARFLPRRIVDGELVTEIAYPSESRIVETDPRGVITTTDLDAWQRPVRVSVVKPGDPLALETRYAYDVAGRVKNVVTRQNGADVTTSFDYDVMGRRTLSSTNNIATVGSATTRTTYDLASRRTITTQPGGATLTTEVDPLGRTIATHLDTGSSPIEQRFAYDLAGNRVFATDLQVASASAFDSHGRVIATRAADGTITTVQHDENDAPLEVKTLDASANETVAQLSFTYTTAGRLQQSQALVDATTRRSTSTVWDGAGRITGIATGNRAAHASFDVSGRALLHMAGAGDATTLAEVFAKSEVPSHDGDLAAATITTEKNGAPVATTMQRDTAGSITQSITGPLAWKQSYDELGHVIEASVPGRPASQWDVDARGAVKRETLPGGATNEYAYDANGAQTSYSDPASEATGTVRDRIGRPVVRSYPDGTSEAMTWDGARLGSWTDRQGRTLSYTYNAHGQLEEIRNGNVVTDRMTYDGAGRMTSWKTPESELLWSGFDLEGRPKRTAQRRFRNGALLDEFEQTHTYNEHGERTFFSMPIAPGATLGSAWTTGITQQYDAMGNVISIARSGGAPLMSATHRNAGRPDARTVFTAGGGSFVRNYTYDDATSRLRGMSVSNANGVFAGSEITWDGLQIASERLLGIASGERHQRWSYDARSRVIGSVYGVDDADADPLALTPGRAKETLTPSDFRTAQERIAANDVTSARTRSFAEQPGHKIASVTEDAITRPFAYQGAERIDDGRFTYEFDAKGRLIRATEKGSAGAIRRFVYSYSGANRLIGRRAEYAPSATTVQWQLEDRAPILASDGLPAETTLVWDPISDRLVAIYETGGPLLKQIIHGDVAYDDPLETTSLDRATGRVQHLYPIYDEAGAGSLQAIVDDEAKLLTRNLPNDPYGAENLALIGPAADRISVTAKKNGTALETITITVHTTEELTSASIAAAAHLTTLSESGAVLHTSPVPAVRTPTDPYALQWTLTAAEWASFTTPTPAAVSVSLDDTLRATHWSPATPSLPLTHPEPFATLTSFLATVAPNTTATTTLAATPTLSLLATGAATAPEIVSAPLHAHPFVEMGTGMAYVRERWFAAETGTFLSPDPLGYVDSSNLYAFAGGDPVNGRDPTGNRSELSDDRRAIAAKRAAEAREQARGGDAAEKQRLDALHRAGTRRMIELRRLGIDVKADDIVYHTEDWLYGLTASGKIVPNSAAGVVEDQTADLVLAVTAFKVAAPAISTAWRAGGVRAATPLVADELAGVALGINPSVVVNVPRAIVNALDAQYALARLTRQVSAELAENPALARTVLSRLEYEAAVRSGWIAAAQYGNAVERIVAARIADDPALSQVFRHVGGPNNPDFTAFGRNFDITTETEAQVMRHMRRPGYGDELIVVTYQRPAAFTTFRSTQ